MYRVRPVPCPPCVRVPVWRSVLLAAAISVGLASAATADTIQLGKIDPWFTSPTGEYRWLNAADQGYAATYRTGYDYDNALVMVEYASSGTTLSGTLTAADLKPDFAYQLKLVGTPGTDANERIGLTGRWWKETWNNTDAKWDNAGNLNDKGTGYPPNPNDLDYFVWRDIPDNASPTGLRYRFTGYLMFDYFVTDSDGGATLDFETGSSYHVLWKTTQRTPEADDGPLKSATFDPDPSSPAYDDNHPGVTVTLYGEFERLPPDGVHFPLGEYACRIILTEESFHGSSGEDAGGWAAAMGADITFTVVPEPAVLTLLTTALAGLVLTHRRRR